MYAVIKGVQAVGAKAIAAQTIPVTNPFLSGNH